MRGVLAIWVSLCLAGCRPVDVDATEPLLIEGTEAPAWIAIEHGTCYPDGLCPHYRLTVHRDGRVEYVGRSNVHARGRRTTSIDPALAAASLYQLAALDVLAKAPRCHYENTSESHSPRTRLEVIGETDGLVVLCNDEAYAPARAVTRKLELEADAAAWVGTWYPCPALHVGLRGEDARVTYVDLGYEPASGPKGWAHLFVREVHRFGTAAIPGFMLTVTGTRTADEDPELADQRAITTRDLLLVEGLDASLMKLSTRVEEAPAFTSEVQVEVPGCVHGQSVTTTSDRTRPSIAESSPPSTLGESCSRCDDSCSAGEVCGDAWVCIPDDCESDEDCPTTHICDASSSTCTTCCLSAPVD